MPISTLDLVLWIGGITLLVSLIGIVYNYAKGLSKSPRELWILFIIKCVENSVYSSITLIITLWLSKDCGLDDTSAGGVIAVYGILLSAMAMLSGALVDSIGIKRTLIFGTTILLLSRLTSFWITSPGILYVTFLAPMAIGFAVMNPVISVGIKRMTTRAGASLGFGLFYILMNLTVAIASWFTDMARNVFAEKDALGKVINENLGYTIQFTSDWGIHFSTYQLILLLAFLSTPLTLILVLIMRHGVHIEHDEVVVPEKEIKEVSSKSSVFGVGVAFIEIVKNAATQTFRTMKGVVSESVFWRFLLVVAIVVFVRLVFQHFHYTFPKYGIRLLGEGAPVGRLYGVLNPIIIVFLVPIVAWVTRNIRSYTMLIVGTVISSFSCFLAYIPSDYFHGWTNTPLGEAVFMRWLGLYQDYSAMVADADQLAAYWPILLFIVIFTVGEAFWSPRLMQFTTEIAPKGKEGSYLALSILPWFIAKGIAAGISGFLLEKYIPEGGSHEHHAMIWVIVGVMAVITPIGLLVFKKFIPHHTAEAE